MGEATLRQGYLDDMANAVIAAKLGSTDFDNMLEKVIEAKKFFADEKDEIGQFGARARIAVIEGFCTRYYDSGDPDRILDNNESVLRDVVGRIRASHAIENRKLTDREKSEISTTLNLLIEDRMRTLSYMGDYRGMWKLRALIKKLDIGSIENPQVIWMYSLGKIGYKLGLKLERKIFRRMIEAESR